MAARSIAEEIAPSHLSRSLPFVLEPVGRLILRVVVDDVAVGYLVKHYDARTGETGWKPVQWRDRDGRIYSTAAEAGWRLVHSSTRWSHLSA